MASSVHDGDLYVRGLLRADSQILPSNSVGSTQFSAADPLATSKQIHRYVKTGGQKRGAAIAGDTGTAVHVARAAGTVVGFEAGFMVDESSWTGNAVIDLKKNGSSVLSGTITLDASTVVGSVNIGTIGTPAYVDNDVFEYTVAFTAGTGTPPQGLFVNAIFDEQPT